MIVSPACPACAAGAPHGTAFCPRCGARLGPPAPPGDARPGPYPASLAGQVIGGRYRVEAAIAAGAMGTVWRGLDLRMHGRRCAIKTVSVEAGSTALEARALFDQECMVLAGLRHAAICEIFDVVFEGEARFLVMEFVEGHTLAQELAWHGRPGLPEATVMAWSLVLVEALAYLHGYQSPDGTPRPIVFRDLKPHNVMLRPDGRLTLIDFGIAHPLRSSGASTFGTSGYSPPEVYAGKAVPATDQYALAATIHQLLTGRDPSQAPPFIFPDPRLAVPSLGTRTADTLAQALSERPEDRFPTIKAFGAALAGRGLLAPASPGVVALGSRFGTRHGLAASAVAGTAALVVTQPQVPLGPGRILTLVAGAGGLMTSAGFPLYVQSSYHTALYDSSTHGWGLAAVLALGAAFGSAVIRGSARSLPPTRQEAWAMTGVGVAGAAGSGLFIGTSAHSAGGAAWLCSLPGLAGYFGLVASLLVIVGACLMQSEARP